MRTRVTEQGLVIPKEWFVGVFEVEIRQENNRIVIVPIIPLADDPLLLLGKDPITLDIADASTHHDTYSNPLGSIKRSQGFSRLKP